MKIKYLLLSLAFSFPLYTHAAFNLGEQEPAPIVVGNPEEAAPAKAKIPLDPVLTVDDAPQVKKNKKIVVEEDLPQTANTSREKQPAIQVGNDPLGDFLAEKGIVTIVPDKPKKNKESKVQVADENTQSEEKKPVVVNDAEEMKKLQDLVNNSHPDGVWNIKDNNVLIANAAQNAKPTLEFYSKGDLYGGAGKPQEIKKSEQQAMKEMDLSNFFNWGLIGLLFILGLGLIKTLMMLFGRKS